MAKIPQTKEDLLRAIDKAKLDFPKTVEEALPLFREVFPDEEDAAMRLFTVAVFEALALQLLDEGPQDPADLIRREPLVFFSSPRFVSQILDLRDRLAASSRIVRRGSGSLSVDGAPAPRPAPAPSGFAVAVQQEDPKPLREALRRIAVAIQSVPVEMEDAMRAVRAADLHEEVRREEARRGEEALWTRGVVGEAFETVARRHGLTGAALTKKLQRDLDPGRADWVKAGGGFLHSAGPLPQVGRAGTRVRVPKKPQK